MKTKNLAARPTIASSFRRSRLGVWREAALTGLLLALSILSGPAAEEETFESPLQPPDTSGPRATLQSFRDNVREAHDALMLAYISYRADPSLFPPESARDAEARAEELLERAVRTLNLSEVSRALRPKVGLERALLLNEVLDRIPLPPFDAIGQVTQTGPQRVLVWSSLIMCLRL